MTPAFQHLVPVTLSDSALARDFAFWFVLSGQKSSINVYRRGLNVYGVEDFVCAPENRMLLMFTLLISSEVPSDPSLLTLSYFGANEDVNNENVFSEIQEMFTKEHLILKK